MTERFPILGVAEIPMLGRKELTDLILTALQGPPVHFSLVAPKHMGKTVFMKNLKNSVIKNTGKSFAYTIFWDMNSLKNYDRSKFLRALSEKILESIKKDEKELGQYLTMDDEPDACFDNIQIVLEELKKKNKRVLMLWDNLDRLIKSPDISIGLWDQMRALTHINLQLITATRDDLKELISDEKAMDSTFWNIFQIHRLEKFSNEDVDNILKKFQNIEFTPTSIEDLEQITGFYPPLLLSLLNQIDRQEETNITNPIIKSCAEKLTEGIQVPRMLEEIYDDLSVKPEIKQVIQAMDSQGISRGSIRDQIRGKLIAYGFCKETEGNIVSNCELLTNYIKGLGDASDSVPLLFGGDNYHKNIKIFLDVKLNNIGPINNEYPFHKIINKQIKCLDEEYGEEDLDEAVRHHRHLSDKFFTIAYETEFGTTTEIPEDRLQRKICLDILVGKQFKDGKRAERKAKYLSKETMVLFEAVYEYQNHGQHRSQNITRDYVVATISGIIDCVSSLTKDVNRTS